MNLVTGATGIVGSHIALELLRRNEPVRALIRPSSDKVALEQLLRFHKMEEQMAKVNWVEGDVNDPISLLNAAEGCTRVYHAAAMVSFRKSDHQNLFLANTDGTGNIVDTCLEKGIKELVYISSTATIGDEEIDGQLSEASAWTTDKGRSSYSLSKRFAEMAVWRGVQEGLKAIIVNPGIIIGPGKWGQSSTTMITSCENGMRFYPDGSNGFVDARDIVRAIDFLMENERWNERFLLIGSSQSYQRFFTEVCSQLGQPAPKTMISKPFIAPVIRFLQWLELMRVNPFPLTSENLKSAYRKVEYSANRIESAGFSFTPIEEAVAYAIAVKNS